MAGVVEPVSDIARRVLAACVVCVDGDGTICATITELSEHAGVSVSTVERAMRELRAASLVHVSGRTFGTFRYVDPKLLTALRTPVSRRTHDDGWREIRARNGGLQRALKATQRERDNAVASYERVLGELRQARLDAGSHTARERYTWLRAQARHAADCLTVDCEQCTELSRLLDEGEDVDVDDAVAAALSTAEEIAEAARALLDAQRMHGVGARQKMHTALETLERVVRS